jgi:hypothetical protein
MTLRKSSKPISTLNAFDTEVTNKEIAVQLVKGFLGSRESQIVSNQNSETQTASTFQARAHLEAFYIASLYSQTVFWLDNIKIPTENKS